MASYILALDQGTTSSRAIVFDRAGQIAAKAQHPFPQIYPQAGWVEHDPMTIWDTERLAAAEAIRGLPEGSIAGIGVTNQRETTIVWDKATGQPVYNAIVWQCRRTAELCEELKRQGLEERIVSTTGLLIDAYFSGTKIRWILDNIPGARRFFRLYDRSGAVEPPLHRLTAGPGPEFPYYLPNRKELCLLAVEIPAMEEA